MMELKVVKLDGEWYVYNPTLMWSANCVEVPSGEISLLIAECKVNGIDCFYLKDLLPQSLEE